MITTFKVHSKRIHDIAHEEGLTVRGLKNILDGAGYDVKEAKITVSGVGKTYIGKLEDHVLAKGDCVSFDTKVFSLPATEERIIKEISDEIANAQEELKRNGAASKCVCKHKDGTKTSIFTSCEDGIEITKNADGSVSVTVTR